MARKLTITNESDRDYMEFNIVVVGMGKNDRHRLHPGESFVLNDPDVTTTIVVDNIHDDSSGDD